MNDAVAASVPIVERRCQYTPGRTILSQRWGVLRLFPERLDWEDDKPARSWSAPGRELHSPRNWLGSGITVYRADKRLAFDFSFEDPGAALATRTAANRPATALGGISGDQIGTRYAARDWTRALESLVATEPPAGVKVKRTPGPDDRLKESLKLIVKIVPIALLLIGVVVALVFALQ